MWVSYEIRVSNVPTNRLNPLFLSAMIEEAGQRAEENSRVVKLNDGGGLMLVVRRLGQASWILRYSFGGRRREMTPGQWPVVGLKLARKMAVDARHTIAERLDPKEARQVGVAGHGQGCDNTDTINRLLHDWLRSKPRAETYLANIEAAFIKDVQPRIGTTAVSDVTPAQVQEILQAVEERGATAMAHGLRTWLRQMFQYGIEDSSREWLVASPVVMG